MNGIEPRVTSKNKYARSSMARVRVSAECRATGDFSREQDGGAIQASEVAGRGYVTLHGMGWMLGSGHADDDEEEKEEAEEEEDATDTDDSDEGDSEASVAVVEEEGEEDEEENGEGVFGEEFWKRVKAHELKARSVGELGSSAASASADDGGLKQLLLASTSSPSSTCSTASSHTSGTSDAVVLPRFLLAAGARSCSWWR